MTPHACPREPDAFTGSGGQARGFVRASIAALDEEHGLISKEKVSTSDRISTQLTNRWPLHGQHQHVSIVSLTYWQWFVISSVMAEIQPLSTPQEAEHDADLLRGQVGLHVELPSTHCARIGHCSPKLPDIGRYVHWARARY